MKDRYAVLSLGVVAVILSAMYWRAQQEGYVDIQTPGVVLQFNSVFGRARTLHSESGTTAVPARVYQPASLELRRHEGDDIWQMSSRGPWGHLSRLRVGRGRTTTIEAGPPLVIRPDVRASAGQVTVDLGIFGRSGERYTNLICKNDDRIAAPDITIIDEAGAVLVADKFHYG